MGSLEICVSLPVVFFHISFLKLQCDLLRVGTGWTNGKTETIDSTYIKYIFGTLLVPSFSFRALMTEFGHHIFVSPLLEI